MILCLKFLVRISECQYISIRVLEDTGGCELIWPREILIWAKPWMMSRIFIGLYIMVIQVGDLGKTTAWIWSRGGYRWSQTFDLRATGEEMVQGGSTSWRALSNFNRKHLHWLQQLRIWGGFQKREPLTAVWYGPNVALPSIVLLLACVPEARLDA